MLDDGLAHARSLTAGFDEAAARLGSATRRWAESVEGVRSSWDDADGRTVFQRLLDPHRSVLETTLPVAGQAVESHRTALEQSALAAEHALRALDAAERATAQAASARRHADDAQAGSAAARGAAEQARSVAQSVLASVAALGS